MRHPLLAVMLSLSPLSPAVAQVSVELNLPGVTLGINQPSYPELVLVPGMPVYYAPGSDLNYFFYDGAYWVYQGDSWYASSWFDGPWYLVDPQAVPLFVLRVPVRYYRRPPPYFQGWGAEAPPRWGERWGGEWERQHGGWDRWDRGAAPRPAPLPVYQRQFTGSRYPPPERQQVQRGEHDRYQPKDEAVRRAMPGPPPRAAPPQPPRAPAPGRPPQSHAQPAQQAPRDQPSPPAPHAQPATPQPHGQPAPRAQSSPPAPHAQPSQPAPHAQPAPPEPHAQPAPPRGQPSPQQPRAQPQRPQGQENARPGKGGPPEPKEEGGRPGKEDRGGDHGH